MTNSIRALSLAAAIVSGCMVLGIAAQPAKAGPYAATVMYLLTGDASLGCGDGSMCTEDGWLCK